MNHTRRRLERVQVVYKKSASELYVKKHRDPRVTDLIERGDPSVQWMLQAHAENQEALQLVKGALKARGVQVRWSYRAKKEGCKGVDLVLAVGGDGTLLEAARMVFDDTPLMGIHSTPTASVGYLCAGHSQQIDMLLDQFLDRTISESFVTRLDVHCNGHVVGPPVLNDILYASPSPAATARYHLSWNGFSEEHRSSGVWIATPVGSTAAVLSAGGQRLDPESTQLQFRVRELYQPQGHIRCEMVGGIFDTENPLQITNTLRKACLYFDGPWTKYPLQYGDIITFTPAKHQLCLLGLK